MENQTNSTPNQNDPTKQNSPVNSIDGFARPSRPAITPSDNSNTQHNSAPVSSTPNTSTSSSNSHVETANPETHAQVTPMVMSGGNNPKKSKVWTIVLVLLILVIFAGGIYGVYAYQQKKINNLNATAAQNATTIASLNKEISTLKSAQSVSVNGSSSASSPTFKVQDLSIQLTVPGTLADLTYVMNSAGTSANLSTTTLGTLDSACKASATSAPLGSLVKINGKFLSSTTQTLVKQYDSYYIAYEKPTTTCSTIAAVNTLAAAQVASLQSTFNTVAAITN